MYKLRNSLAFASGMTLGLLRFANLVAALFALSTSMVGLFH
jgi:hypothetical protein